MLKDIDRADILELRLDHLGMIPFAELKERTKKHIIVTIRIPAEGGFWKGTETERVKIFQQAVNDQIDFLDIEWNIAPNLLNELTLPPKTKIIISHHVQENKSEDLYQVFKAMQGMEAEIYKLVYWARHLNDNLITLDLLEEAHKEGNRCVVHAMGEAGQPSRLIGAIRGNAWSYVSLPQAGTTAEGQISLDVAHNIYGLHSKSKNTRITGLLGFPLLQSTGWQFHNRLIQHLKNDPEFQDEKIQDFLYLNFPEKNFDQFWEHWNGTIDGLSVTIPHKQRVVEKLDLKSSTVDKSGVCNTMLKRNDLWWGFNTDMLAIYDLLCESGCEQFETALVYGTGATARSAITALQELNCQNIFLHGRNQTRGRQLAEMVSIEFISGQEIRDTKAEVIIQTTLVGMIPNTDDSPPISHLLSKAKLVLDVVHKPPITQFLKEAQTAGCQIISGEQMYLRQAAYQFRLFCGVTLPLSVLENLLKRQIEK
jgi:3-dehydroquinate dehydratase/shikimate dehydrogenase